VGKKKKEEKLRQQCEKELAYEQSKKKEKSHSLSLKLNIRIEEAQGIIKGRELIKCSQCNSLFNQAGLKKHSEQCDREYKIIIELNQTKNRRRVRRSESKKEQERIVSCKKCGVELKAKNMNRHNSIKHPKPASSKNTRGNDVFDGHVVSGGGYGLGRSRKH